MGEQTAPDSGGRPVVAIVGRPNVGKSTLFNRYAGHRRALVEDTPGLTRDRIVEEVEVEGRRVLVVDTAGLEPDAEGGLSVAIQAQARTALREADDDLRAKAADAVREAIAPFHGDAGVRMPAAAWLFTA
ncbi:MAG: GTPase, partial [Acidimicrobiales bacterium]